MPAGGVGACPDNEPTRQATRQHTRSHRCEGRRRAVRGLAAVPVGGGGAWPDIEPTRQATRQHTKPHWCEGRRRVRRARLRHPRAAAGPGRGAGGWRQGQGGPRDRPLRAVRLACGDLAGGPPPTGTQSDLAHRSGRHNKTARPQWGRAAVAVALGFEPRVAVTPHSISSAAPSAARTRYLTRILYYTLPPSAQIDRAGWEQGHIAAWEQGPARSHGSTQNGRHLTIQND